MILHTNAITDTDTELECSITTSDDCDAGGKRFCNVPWYSLGSLSFNASMNSAIGKSE